MKVAFPNKTIVCVGSLNPVKINAVRKAFSDFAPNLNIVSIDVISGVPNQPIGIENIIGGAINRAKKAFEHSKTRFKTEGKDLFGVGLEAGLVKIPYSISGYMDFQFCAITSDGKIVTLGSGVGFEYPRRIVNDVLEKGLEIGELMGRLANNPNLKREMGAIGYLSEGILKREEILKEAVLCALLPRINRKEYN